MPEFDTVRFEVSEGVGWLTLNRPEVMNSFNSQMQRELHAIWSDLRSDRSVRVVVVTGAGERAFCAGVDRTEALGAGKDAPGNATGFRSTPFHFDDPGSRLGPKSNDLWTPVVAAVNGVACGGAFYLLGEADVILAADTATFFDPHVTYGMPAAYESMLMVSRMPLGEVLRMQLMGASERLSAERALQIGLVSEVVPLGQLSDAAARVAQVIAASPALAVQATVRATWAAAELSRSQALGLGYAYVAMGTDPTALAEGQNAFEAGRRVEWRLR